MEKMVLFYKEVENSEAKFSTVESTAVERNAYKVKLIEEFTQERGNKVLCIIKKFHP